MTNKLNARLKLGVDKEIIIDLISHYFFETLKEIYPKNYDIFQGTEWIAIGKVTFFKE